MKVNERAWKGIHSISMKFMKCFACFVVIAVVLFCFGGRGHVLFLSKIINVNGTSVCARKFFESNRNASGYLSSEPPY